MSQNSKVPDPEVLDKEVKVLELRRSGLTWARIGEEVGYADPSGAYMAYKRAIKRTLQQPADEVRELEVERLDRMQLSLWQRVLKGDDKAINTSLRIMERRARLLGLDATQKIQAEVITYDGNADIDGDIERIIQLLKSAYPPVEYTDAELVGDGGEIQVESGTGEDGTVTS